MKDSYQQIIIAILILILFMRLCNRSAETYSFSGTSDLWDIVQGTGDSVKRGAGMARDMYGDTMDTGGNALDFVGSGIGGIRADGSSLLDSVPGIQYVKPARDMYGGGMYLVGSGFRGGRNLMGSGRALGGRGLDAVSGGSDFAYESVKDMYGGAVRTGDKGVRMVSGAVNTGAGLYDAGVNAGVQVGLRAGRKIKGFFN